MQKIKLTILSLFMLLGVAMLVPSTARAVLIRRKKSKMV